LKLYPAAGEATITHAPVAGRSSSSSWSSAKTAKSSVPTVSHATRAKGKVRRYCRANREDRLVTLTYRDAPAARSTVTEHVRRFRERFQKVFGRRAIVAVIERGGTTGRLHVHLALNFYVPKAVLARIWGHGFVDIRKSLRGRQQWRHRDLAGYLAKYVAKALDPEAEDGPEERAKSEHRYLVSQGFTPKSYRLRYHRIGQAHERLIGLYGHPDIEAPFGDWAEGLIYGIWYGFPDHLLHPPPGTLRAG